MNQDWISALSGGIVIGIAVSLMLLWNGRVAGISGVVGGLLSPVKNDVAWRFMFILGLMIGGALLAQVSPMTFSGSISKSWIQTALAGALVGFGTSMGNGCTSGHGVCGISRLSPRSIAATLVFILGGMMAVPLFKSWGAFP